MGGRLEFRVLGPLTVLVDGEVVPAGGPKQRALLALLLLSANRVVSRDRLVAELFPEQSVNSADHALRNHVSRLRKILSLADEPRLVARAPGYLLRVEPGELDLERFEVLAEDGRDQLANHNATAAAHSLRAAESMWHGRPLADLEFEPFAQFEVERLEEARLAVVETRVDAELALGRHAVLVPELESLVAEHPLRERFRAQQMLALYRSGRQAESLDVYQRTRRLLDEELGLVPGPELQSLERAILVHDSALGDTSLATTRRIVRTPEAPPFKGLSPYEEADAELFFGRERLVDELVARLAETPFLAVVGASGSGKSSLLRAGLLPAMARAGWEHVVVRPGPRAHELLAEDRPHRRVAVVIDQFEETFATSVGEQERRTFLDRVVDAAWDADRRSVIVLALRADFVAHVAAYVELADLVAANQLLLGPMSSGDLRRVIERPSEHAGLTVEPALVDELVGEIAGEQGALPLLSTSMLDLWRARTDDTLTLDAYEQMGGVRGAVARFAEAAYTALDPPSRRVARSVLVQLAAGDDGDALTRKRVTPAELGDEANPVVSELVERRLLVAHEGTIELVHDALLEHWPRLKAWLADDAENRRVRDRLTQAAANWDAGGRDSQELYRGVRLTAALEWADGPKLSPLARDFLEQSRIATTQEIDRRRRANRRLRLALAAVLVALAAAVIAGSVAIAQREHARERARAADAQRVGLQALLDQSLDRSLLLAREAVSLDDSQTTRSDLLTTLLRSNAALRVAHASGMRVLDETLSPDGKRLAVRSEDGTITFFDTRTLRPDGSPLSSSDQIGLMGAIVGPLRALAFAPDDQMIAIGSTTGTNTAVYLVQPSTRKTRWYETDGDEHVADLYFSPNGRFVATAEPVDGRLRAPPAQIRVRDTRTGKTLATSPPKRGVRLRGYTSDGRLLLVTLGPSRSTLLDSHTLKQVRTLPVGGTAALSPTGGTAAFGGEDGTVSIVELKTGRRRLLSGRAAGEIATISYSGDGRELATGDVQGDVEVWDPHTGLVDTFTGHTSDVRGVVFSPDGRTIYSAGSDGAVIAWDATGARRLGRTFTFAAPGPEVAFASALTPDGSLVATSPADGRVDLRSTGTYELRRELVAPIGAIHGVAVSGDGRLILAGGETGAALWDARSGALGRIFDRSIREGAVAISPDGNAIATAPAQKRVVIYDARSGQVIARLRIRHTDSLAFDADGGLLAAGKLDGTATVWDTRTRKPLAELPSGASAVYSVEFSPDRSLLAVGDSSGGVTLFDMPSGRKEQPALSGNGGGAGGLSFSPDGKTLLVAGADGALRLWDVQTKTLVHTLPSATSSGTTAFFPDGKRVLGVFGTGIGVVWNLDPNAWEAQACRIANRDLTRAEWAELLPGREYRPVCPG